jgi:hypothetical protein
MCCVLFGNALGRKEQARVVRRPTKGTIRSATLTNLMRACREEQEDEQFGRIDTISHVVADDGDEKKLSVVGEICLC